MAWFSIKGYEGLYDISDTLEVRNARSLRIIPVNSGKVTLCKDGAAVRVRPSELTPHIELEEKTKPAVVVSRRKFNVLNEQIKSYPWYGEQSHAASMVGDAGEALVCAELLMRGVRASYNVMAGAPYDIVADFGDSSKMFTIQVKSTSGPYREGGKTERYSFSNCSNSKCDLFAYVALDTRAIMMEWARASLPRHQMFPCFEFVRNAEGTIDQTLHEIYAHLNPESSPQLPEWLK